MKASKKSVNLLNGNRQITYPLYWEKEITKTVYNNIMNSLKLVNRMDTIFMNFGNGKIKINGDIKNYRFD